MDHPGRPPQERLRVVPMDATTIDAVVAFARSAWDRPVSGEYLAWRYRAAPAEGVVALAGEGCVAKIFALEETWHTPTGNRACLEPYEWYAHAQWRATGAGLRVMKRLMADERPLVAIGGTPDGVAIITRLGWTRICDVAEYVLPLRGAFLRARGRSAAMAAAFNLLGRWYFTPRSKPNTDVTLRTVTSLGAGAREVAERQQRFAWMRMPNARTTEWLGHAPAEVGRFVTHEVLVSGEVVGWASTRTYLADGVRVGALQEVFLRDEARACYADAVRAACASLAADRVDVVRCLTSCPDTTAALRLLRFRHEADTAGFVWMGGAPAPGGPGLFDGRHADRAFRPVGTAADAQRAVVARAG